MVDTIAPDGEQRLVLNPYVTVVRYTDDEVLYRHGSRSGYSRVLRDEGRRRVLGPVLAAFREPCSRADARQRVAGGPDGAAGVDTAVAEVTDRLVDDGVLVPEQSSRFATYLRMRTGQQPAGLATATVGLVGVGGIGGQIGQQLAALGVGEIIGLDDRPVAPGDQPLLRGTIGNAGKVGAPVTAAFAAAAAASGFDSVSVRDGSVDDDAVLVDLLEEVDLLVVALESFPPSLLHRVNEAAITTEKPWLPVHADGSEVVIGPLVVPGRSPCYNEYEIQHESSRVLRTEYLLYKEELAGRPLLAAPQLLPPYAGIAASWAVTGALPYLLDGASFLVGRVVRVDFERLEVINERVLRLPRCPACAGLRPDYRHPFL
jgi:bacteriocin biosynthesis cyclodehydratase domain-containing protein